MRITTRISVAALLRPTACACYVSFLFIGTLRRNTINREDEKNSQKNEL